MAETKDPIVVKKYANRRLYDTESSTYVTLEDLATMVKAGREFVVSDAKTGEDITRSVLTQIIFEQENKGQNLLPVTFLRQLIRFYGDSLQGVVPSYLDMAMQSFAKDQERLREHMTQAFGAPFGAYEEQVRQNMAMFERAFRMFSPFAMNEMLAAQKGTAAAPAPPPASDKAGADGQFETLRKQMQDMQRQLDEFTKKR